MMGGVPSGANDVLVTAEPYVHSVDHDEGFRHLGLGDGEVLIGRRRPQRDSMIAMRSGSRSTSKRSDDAAPLRVPTMARSYGSRCWSRPCGERSIRSTRYRPASARVWPRRERRCCSPRDNWRSVLPPTHGDLSPDPSIRELADELAHLRSMLGRGREPRM